jgi:hypothetical protein
MLIKVFKSEYQGFYAQSDYALTVVELWDVSCVQRTILSRSNVGGQARRSLGLTQIRLVSFTKIMMPSQVLAGLWFVCLYYLVYLNEL